MFFNMNKEIFLCTLFVSTFVFQDNFYFVTVPYLAKPNQVNKYTHQNRLASSARTPPAPDI